MDQKEVSQKINVVLIGEAIDEFEKLKKEEFRRETTPLTSLIELKLEDIRNNQYPKIEVPGIIEKLESLKEKFKGKFQGAVTKHFGETALNGYAELQKIVIDQFDETIKVLAIG